MRNVGLIYATEQRLMRWLGVYRTTKWWSGRGKSHSSEWGHWLHRNLAASIDEVYGQYFFHIDSLNPWFNAMSIHWCINTVKHSLLHSFLHSFLSSFLPSFLASFIPSFIPPFIFSFLSSFIHSFILSFLHSLSIRIFFNLKSRELISCLINHSIAERNNLY